ncbi:hypothetical protein [Delftia phage PhiW-14]|uniref:Uncharacterized protein n=1 Tax=Delftia phage PhiW-14 TaxID=665032 RepID=C9DGA4_BPW14|nr:hypothetical protein DP-phiW-14_gp134 [Delftia phage PhiW-14]ACV50155.1 hypothetical protein [Delftia phage PhiW-14]
MTEATKTFEPSNFLQSEEEIQAWLDEMSMEAAKARARLAAKAEAPDVVHTLRLDEIELVEVVELCTGHAPSINDIREVGYDHRLGTVTIFIKHGPDGVGPIKIQYGIPREIVDLDAGKRLKAARIWAAEQDLAAALLERDEIEKEITYAKQCLAAAKEMPDGYQ